jgi:hypothetical protein
MASLAMLKKIEKALPKSFPREGRPINRAKNKELKASSHFTFRLLRRKDRREWYPFEQNVQ